MSSEKAYDLERRLNQHITGTQASLGTPDVTTTGIKTLGAGLDAIPAGSLAGGEDSECDAGGTFTTGGTAPTTMNFYLYYGSIATGVQINSFAVPGAGLWINAAGQPWILKGKIVWMSATEVVASITLHWRTATGIGSSIVWHNYADTTGIDTTAVHNLNLGFGFTGAAMTLHTDYVHFTRKR